VCYEGERFAHSWSAMSNVSQNGVPTQTLWLTSAGASKSRPLFLASGHPSEAIAGQISEHLVRHLQRQASKFSSVSPTRPPAAAPAAAEQPPGNETPLSPPEHVLSSTTLLSSWLASTNATWSEEDLRRLSLHQETGPAPATGPAFALFTLGGHRWGVPLQCLREVLPALPPLTPLPFSPPWLHGIINVRSDPVGLVNLSELVLDPISASTVLLRVGEKPVLIAESNGIPFALLVEEVNETIFPEESQLQPPNSAETRWLPALAIAHLKAIWIRPSTQETILLLDLPRLLATLLQQDKVPEVAGG
jgi:chemotaxis signal transduction protein